MRGRSPVFPSRPTRPDARRLADYWRALLSTTLTVVALVGCAAPRPQPEPGAADLAAAYRTAIFDSAVFDPASVHALHAIPPGTESVSVVTWATATTAERFYPLGDTTVGVDVWVTLGPQVQQRCATYPTEPSALRLRLQQLLGLPPGADPRTFVVMRAAVKDIFRPCPDPDPTEERCGASFPATADAQHQAWIARQALARYRTPPQGFPWTRLGYTYDWNPESGKLGVSEYVLRNGSAVTVTAKIPTLDYCHPPRG